MTDRYLISGCPTEGDSGGVSSGKVYVHDLKTWTLVKTLDNPNVYGTSVGDYFGFSLAADSRYLAVGAREDGATGANSGKVYIFDMTTWLLVRIIDDPNAYGTPADDYFGANLLLTGDSLIVASLYEDEATGANSGKVYIFDITTGVLLRTISNPNAYSTSTDDRFGISMSASGTLIAIRANEDDASGTDSGKVYIFDTTTGLLLRTINDPNAFGTPAGDYFGSSLSLSGNCLIVGASQEDETSFTSSGKVYVFDANTGVLVQTISNPSPQSTTADVFGESIVFDGTNLVISARGVSVTGRVHIYN